MTYTVYTLFFLAAVSTGIVIGVEIEHRRSQALIRLLKLAHAKELRTTAIHASYRAVEATRAVVPRPHMQPRLPVTFEKYDPHHSFTPNQQTERSSNATDSL